MSDPLTPLRSAHRGAYGVGLALCLGTPVLIALLILSGVVPPGTQAPVGFLEQVGYLFTGVVFLASSFTWWRLGQVLRGFKELPERQRAQVLLRESLVAAATCESSSLLGLAYWCLVGNHATRHVWGFILLTPILFLALVPRLERWVQALDADASGANGELPPGH